MSFTIGKNIAGLRTLRQLNDAGNELASVMERLATGQRINRAVDDAAGLSIASSLEADTRVYTQAVRNLNDGISLLQIADGALQELSKITLRISELAEQSSNAIYSSPQRDALDREAQALALEYQRILESTEYNGINLFPVSGREVTLQTGYGSAETIGVTLGVPHQNLAANGTFLEIQEFGTGSDPNSIKFADINEDGNIDLVATNDGGIVFATGDGDGTLSGSPLAMGVRPRHPQIIDFNNDGHLDVAVINRDDGTFSVNLGTGTGAFAGAVSFATLGVSGMHAGDFNGDQIADIAVTNSSDSVFLHIGNGDGTFASAITVGRLAREFGDVNGDGILDLVDKSAGISIGNGDGTFGPTIYYGGAGIEGSTRLADLDGDGDSDLIQYNSAGPAIRIMKNDGSGAFSLFTQLNYGGSGRISSGDMNGDGKVDLIQANGNSIRIFLGNGDLTYQEPYNVASQVSTFIAFVADLNNDGILDIVTGNDANEDSISTFLGQGEASVVFPEFSLRTQAESRAALEISKSVQDGIAAMRGKIGATLSRIQVAVSAVQARADTLNASRSRMVDADIAQDAAELLRLRIKQQTTASILAQANQQPELVLALLASPRTT